MIEHTFKVGRRLHCTMSLRDGVIRAEWDPGIPRNMKRQMWRNYRRGRGEFMEMVAAAEGFSLTIEPDGSVFEHHPPVRH